MSATGVGASVGRKEDDRFLRGRGQYVADFRLPGMREVAFVRSPVAHGAHSQRARSRRTHKGAVFTARGSRRRQSRSAPRPRCSGFKHSAEPILAARQGPLRRRARRHVRGALARRGRGHRRSRRRSTTRSCTPSSTCWPRAAPARRWCTRSGATTSSSSFSQDGADRAHRRNRRRSRSRAKSAPRASACSRSRGAASSPIGTLGSGFSPSSARPRCRTSCSAASPSASASTTARFA